MQQRASTGFGNKEGVRHCTHVFQIVQLISKGRGTHLIRLETARLAPEMQWCPFPDHMARVTAAATPIHSGMESELWLVTLRAALAAAAAREGVQDPKYKVGDTTANEC